jgi:DNA-directed RNA polymerase subunit F
MKKDDIFAMSVACKALDYKRANSSAQVEDVMKYVIGDMQGRTEFKMKAIAAVNRALKYKEKGSMTDKEILQKVMDELPEIFNKMKFAESSI